MAVMRKTGDAKALRPELDQAPLSTAPLSSADVFLVDQKTHSTPNIAVNGLLGRAPSG